MLISMSSCLDTNDEASATITPRHGDVDETRTFRLRAQYRVEMLDDGERESSPDIVSGEPCQQDLLR